MLTASYRRRAFFLIALAALPATPAAAAETLWDLLARPAPTPTVEAAPTTPAPAARRPLGPVPGFLVPVKPGDDIDAVFSKKRKPGGFFGDLSEWWGRMKASKLIDIRPSGFSTLRLQTENVSGNFEAYRDSLYLGRGSNGIYNDTRVSIDATFLKHFTYKTTFTNSPFRNPYENRVQLDYNTKPLRVEWGDINAGFQGNSLIDFNRFLRGVRVTNNWSRQFRTQLIYSETRAEARTITIQGNNSAGPYFVYAGFIVEGSDRLRIDNEELIRGRDYLLNLENGELRFTNGRVVLQSQTIAVTFETVGFDPSRGTVYGLRSEFTPGGSQRYGLTYVTQQSRGTAAPQARRQQFFGQTDPALPYVLDTAIDRSKPVIVTVQGVPLAPGTDYVIDPNLNNLIYVRQSIPPTNVLQVEYFPLSTTPIPGNRSVLGVDGTLKLGSLGTATLEGAFSGLSLSGENIRGRAMQLTADLTPLRNLRSTLRIRDIDPNFSSIQSPGFNRQERAIDLLGDYRFSDRLSLNGNWQKAWRPSYGSAFGGNQFAPVVNGKDLYDQYGLGINWDFLRIQRKSGAQENGTLRIGRNSAATRFFQGGRSQNISDDLTINYTAGSLGLQAGLSRVRSYADSLFTPTDNNATPQTFTADSATFSKRLGLNWRALRWLELRGSYSDNDITSRGTGITGVNRAQARDTQLGARFTLIPKVTVNYNYQLSDTGNYGRTLNTNTGGTGGTGGTGTGGTGTGGSVIGGQTRAYLADYLRSRQAPPFGGAGTTTGADLGGSLAAFSSANSTQFGGGANYGLGNSGNYGGFYGGAINKGYGINSFGGRSSIHSLNVEYAPSPTLQIGLGLDASASLGDYQFNSNRSGFRVSATWNPNDRLSFSARYDTTSVRYQQNFGGSDTGILFLTLQAQRLIGKLNAQLNWAATRTKGAANFSAVGNGQNNALTDTSSNVSQFWARLDYPLAARQTLFLEYAGSAATGFLASTDTDLRLGLEYGLTRELNLALGWQLISRANRDAQNTPFNYRVSSLLAELRLNFR